MSTFSVTYDTPAFFHDPQLRAETVEDSFGVDIHGAIPALIGFFVDGNVPSRDSACNIGCAVQGSIIRDYLLNPSLDLLAVTHVDDGGGVMLLVRHRQGTQRFVEPSFVHIGYCDDSSSLSQQFGCCKPNSTGRSGNGDLNSKGHSQIISFTPCPCSQEMTG